MWWRRAVLWFGFQSFSSPSSDGGSLVSCHNTPRCHSTENFRINLSRRKDLKSRKKLIVLVRIHFRSTLFLVIMENYQLRPTFSLTVVCKYMLKIHQTSCLHSFRTPLAISNRFLNTRGKIYEYFKMTRTCFLNALLFCITHLPRCLLIDDTHLGALVYTLFFAVIQPEVNWNRYRILYLKSHFRFWLWISCRMWSPQRYYTIREK